MRRALIVFVGIACLSVVTALPAAGQELRLPTNAPVAKALEMAEDLEIMGAVLRSALTEAYSKPMVQPVTRRSRLSGWSRQFGIEVELEGSAVPSIGRPDGAYLPGYGVVYQLTLDVPAPERRSSEDAAENGGDPQLGPVQVETLEGLDVLVVRGQKADVDRAMKIIASGEWKDTARRLRGEPPAQSPTNVAEAWQMPSADDLVDKLLDVLAENAGNFRHLKSQDRLSVAITFPRSKAPATASNNTAATDLAIALFQADNKAVSQAGRSSYEVSGDLHMRQRNYQEAVKAYRLALTSLPDNAALRIKLAQAYLSAQDLAKAAKLLEPLADDSQHRQKTSPSATSRKIPLPARLTVSVPKSRLDEVAAGKMKPEELKGHATVDYFNPPADRPGLGWAKPGPSMGPGGGDYDGAGDDVTGYGSYAPGPSRPRGKQGTNR